MCSSMSFEIESIIETFLAECTQVPFNIAVIFHVSIHETLQLKSFLAYLAFVFIFWIIDYFNSFKIFSHN